MATDDEIRTHLREIAALAGVETSDEQLEAIAAQVVMLMRRFPASSGEWSLGEIEPAFGLPMRKG